MKRADRSELVKALQTFEAAAETPEDCNTAIQACTTWEILFRKHEKDLSPEDVKRYKQRAHVALTKALA